MKAAGLPSGIAAVRIHTPSGNFVRLSERLSKEEQACALKLARKRTGDGGTWAAVVTENEVYAMLGDAA